MGMLARKTGLFNGMDDRSLIGMVRLDSVPESVFRSTLYWLRLVGIYTFNDKYFEIKL